MSPSSTYSDRGSFFDSDCESGYVSADSSTESLHEVFFTKPHLKFINAQLQQLPPEDILRWAMTSLPSLHQETAFGLSGLVTIDMLSRLSNPTKTKIELIFMDTLHHFDETLSLLDKVRAKYPNMPVNVFKPKDADTADEFAARYGSGLWETNEELYDWTAKVEPSERAHAELGVKAVLTGRRKGQGGARKCLPIIEVEDTGLIKVNPLANWSFEEVKQYIDDNDVPYNELLDQGYKSVGDWHSTQPVSDGEDERAGRWKGRDKTECGIHNPKSRYAALLMEQAQREQEVAVTQAFQRQEISA